VVAWTVVIKPSMIVNLSLMTLARGARQLVVQLALEILRHRSNIVKEELIERNIQR
jgi:hypothetical protein